MGKSLLVNAGTFAENGTTQYNALGTGNLAITFLTEAVAKTIFRFTCTLSKLTVNVSANAATGAGSVKVRKNGADGNQSVTIGAGLTGQFEDTVNTDSVSATDELDYQLNFGTGGSTTFKIISVVCDSASNTNQILMMYNEKSFSTASSTVYISPIGDGSHNATETVVHQKVGAAGTAKNYQVYVSVNSRTTSNIFTFRKNGAGTTMTITVGAGLTGRFEDTTNTVSVAADDTISNELVTSTGSETFKFTILASQFESTANKFPIGQGYSSASVAFNVTTYTTMSGRNLWFTTESETQTKIQTTMIVNTLHLYVHTNTIATSATTFRSRKNTANGNISVSIGAGLTGLFSDTSNSDILVSGDLYNFQIVTPNTSGSIVLTSFTAIGTNPQTITKNLTFDAILQATKTILRTFDAFLVFLKTKNISFDALLQATKTKSLIYDALLQATKTKSLIFDSILVFIKTKSLIYDAMLQDTKNKLLTFDAMLLATKIKSLVYDALLQATKTKNILFDALLQATKTKNLIYDAFLQATKTKSLIYDAFLQATKTKPVLFNALLQATKTKSILFDAIIFKPGSGLELYMDFHDTAEPIIIDFVKRTRL